MSSRIARGIGASGRSTFCSVRLRNLVPWLRRAHGRVRSLLLCARRERPYCRASERGYQFPGIFKGASLKKDTALAALSGQRTNTSISGLTSSGQPDPAEGHAWCVEERARPAGGAPVAKRSLTLVP